MHLFGRASVGSDFHRLDVNLSEFERHGGERAIFGTPRLWGDVFAIRYDSNQAAVPEKSLDPPGVLQDPVHVREILNLGNLREFLQYCSDKDSKQIDSILSAATPVEGDEPLGSLVAPYSNTSAYGRKYARSASGQKLSRLGRSVAYRSHGVDIDIENCHASLLLRLLIQAFCCDGRNPEDAKTAHPVLSLYVAHYKEWRTFVEAYYDYTPTEAKKSTNAIFGGGRCPPGDAPCLHALRVEVSQAATYLCSHRIRAHLGKHYARRARPLFGQLSAIISFEGDAVMGQIMDIVNRPPICMVFDGSIYEARHLRDVISVRGECEAAATTLGVRIAAKKRDSLARISDESGVATTWGRMLASGMAHLSAPLVILSGASMCLYNAVRFLCLPYLHDVPKTDGPRSVSRYNEMVRRYSQTCDIQ